MDTQLRYSEKPLSNIKPVKSVDFKRKKVDFELNEVDYSLTVANIDKVDFKPVSLTNKVENYREHVEALSSIMINLLNDAESFQERILILCKYANSINNLIIFIIFL